MSRSEENKAEDVLDCPTVEGAVVEQKPISVVKIIIGLVAVAFLLVAYWILWDSGYLKVLMNEESLRTEIARLGYWGPVAVIALMTAAIVMSPIPSGPIALVAGAVYGPVLGAIYVIVGALMGAATAFWLARCLGYDLVCRWLKGHLAYLIQRRSQNRLMAIVFASRLVPFISFDAISYAAGLTPLSFWRFIVATLAGVIPVSFLLTYFGDRLVAVESEWTTAFVLVIGLVTLLPIGIKLLRRRNQR